jgi:hypothetical protein
MPPVNPMPFWLGISVMYLILTIGVFMTWLKLREFHKEVDSYTYLTKDGLVGGGISLGSGEEPRINLERLFLKLVTANLLALVISLCGAILTFTQAL